MHLFPSTWTSGHLGKSVEEAFEFLQIFPYDDVYDAEKPYFNREYLAVLDAYFYEGKGWMLYYHLDEEIVVTCIPCTVENAAMWPVNSTFQEWVWRGGVDDWQSRGLVW